MHIAFLRKKVINGEDANRKVAEEVEKMPSAALGRK
jgi:hypothetical protein